MKGWITKTIGELCDAGDGSVQTGPFGSQLHESDYTKNGTPAVMPANILGGRIELAGIARISDAHVYRLRRHELQDGDIVYGRRRGIGRPALIRHENAGWLCGTGCLRIRLGKTLVTPEFLHRYLALSDVIRWTEGQAIGATMANTNILRRVPVRFPENVLVQQKIAAVPAFDHLIEINRRRVELLEKLAEEIYREWFVRLRFPGYKNVRIIKGLPRGWELLPFSDIVLVNPEERIDKTEESPFVGMEDLSLNSMFFSVRETRREAQGAKFKNRDVLFPRITPSVENGKRGLVMCLEDGQVGLGSTEFIVLRQKVIGPEHIYFLSCSFEFRKHAALSMAGASGRRRVQEECFSFFLVKTPPPEIREEFSTFVGPIFSQIQVLSRAIGKLKSCREALLPRLLSGKLSVEDLEINFLPDSATELEMEQSP